MVKTLVCYSEHCMGCRSCEIACSYHHTRSFSRRGSSIHVRRWERKGGFEIKINREEGRKQPSCDLCMGEPAPLCVRFCVPKALKVEER